MEAERFFENILPDWHAFYGRIGIPVSTESLRKASSLFWKFRWEPTPDDLRKLMGSGYIREAPLAAIIIPREVSIPKIVDAFIMRVSGLGFRADYWKRVRDDTGIYHDRNPERGDGYCIFSIDPLADIGLNPHNDVFYLGVCNTPSDYGHKDVYLAGASLTETLVWLLYRLERGKGFPMPTGCIFSLGSHMEQLELSVRWNSKKKDCHLEWLVF